MKQNHMWFPHDWGARNDPKVQDILFECGGEGGFAYWVTVEMLYEQGGYLPRKSYRQIAYQAHCPSEVVAYVIEKSGLFSCDEERFWSDRILEELQEQQERTASAKRSASARWKPSQCERNANAMQTHSDSNAITRHNKTIQDNINITDAKASASSSAEDEVKSGSEEGLLIPGIEAENSKLLTAKQCDEVVEFWNKTIKESGANYSQVRTVTDGRRDKVRVRWREFEKLGDPKQVYREIVAKACASSFLQGASGARGFKASFDWIFVNDKNWVKILEGNYDDSPGRGGKPLAGISDRSGGIVKVNDYWDKQDFSDVIEE